jgi:hypothetical protein
MPDLDESSWYTDVKHVRAGRFETGLDNGEIKDHIDAANMVVVENLEDSGMTDRRLERIERNLARHRIKFLVESERMTSSEKTGPISRSFAGAFDGEALKATPYGQTATKIDESSTLGPGGGGFWTVSA